MLLIPKKNGKSLLVAILALYELLRFENESSDILILSPAKSSYRSILESIKDLINSSLVYKKHINY